MTTSSGFKVIRGGRLLDAPSRRREATDVLKRLTDHGARVAHDPGSNMRLGCGRAPVREVLAAGVDVGVGIDGGNCSDDQNMFEAMRVASFVSRVRSHDPGAWLSTGELFTLATEGSARVLGLGRKPYHVHVMAGGDY